MLGFGVLTGTGIGFGYASATPPAVKWFPAAKTGMIAGFVVSGFGLARVYAAPLTNWLVKLEGGVPRTMLILGIAFLIVVVALAQLLRIPPTGYVPPGYRASRPRVRPPRKWTSGRRRCCAPTSSTCCGSCMRVGRCRTHDHLQARDHRRQAGRRTLGFVLVASWPSAMAPDASWPGWCRIDSGANRRSSVASWFRQC